MDELLRKIDTVKAALEDLEMALDADKRYLEITDKKQVDMYAKVMKMKLTIKKLLRS